MSRTRAKPCFNCGRDDCLQFKNWDGDLFWIHCDGCGQIGPQKSNAPDAGDAWNELCEQKEKEKNK